MESLWHIPLCIRQAPSPLVEQARQAAQPMRRSVASQIEYWATLGCEIVEHTGLSVQEARAAIEQYEAGTRLHPPVSIDALTTAWWRRKRWGSLG